MNIHPLLRGVSPASGNASILDLANPRAGAHLRARAVCLKSRPVRPDEAPALNSPCGRVGRDAAGLF